MRASPGIVYKSRLPGGMKQDFAARGDRGNGREIRSAGMELVRIRDRPEGSRLGAYRYIIEVENEKGRQNRD